MRAKHNFNHRDNHAQGIATEMQHNLRADFEIQGTCSETWIRPSSDDAYS
jgi:hypothetical protein